ncbi:unnamed protein product, partial [Gulo gulo]
MGNGYPRRSRLLERVKLYIKKNSILFKNSNNGKMQAVYTCMLYVHLCT